MYWKLEFSSDCYNYGGVDLFQKYYDLISKTRKSHKYK